MTNEYVFNDRYNSIKYGLEQKSSYNYFRMYLQEPKPRNLKEFHKHLSEKISEKNPRKRVPSYQTIYDYSHKWCWNPRAEAYDKFMEQAEDEELRELYRTIRKDSLRNGRARLEYQNKLLHDLESNVEFTAKDKIYASARNSEAYHNEIASINSMYNEGKTVQELEADVRSDNRLDFPVKSVFDELRDLDKELESVYDDDGADKTGAD